MMICQQGHVAAIVETKQVMFCIPAAGTVPGWLDQVAQIAMCWRLCG